MMRRGIFLLLICLFSLNVQAQDKKALKKATKYAKKGEKAYEKRNFEKSVFWFTAAIDQNPNLDDYYYQLSKSNLVLLNDSAIIADCNKGIQLNPSKSQCYYLRGRGYSFSGLHQAAFNDFTTHATIHGETKETLVGKAQSLFGLKDYREAIPYYNEIIAMEPKRADYYFARAFCFIHTDNLDKAELDLKSLGELADLTAWDYQFIQGLFYLRKKEFQKSIIAFDSFVTDTNGYVHLLSPDIYWYFSNAYHANGQLDSAIIQINKAIDSQESAKYYLDRGNYYAELEDMDNALLDYSKAIELDSSTTGAYNNRTFYIWFPQKKFQNAVQDMTAIIDLDQYNAYAYSNRSYAYYGLKDFEHAFIDAFKSVELEKRNPYVYKNLALLYFAIGEKEEATNAVKGALNWGFPVESDVEFQTVMKELGFEE